MNAQELQFELMKKTFFDGDKVVKDLKANKELWRGAVVMQDFRPLIALRDIDKDFYNADTVYILSVKRKECELRVLADNWGADTIEWIEPDEAMKLLGSSEFREEKQLLRVWWD